MELKKTRQIKNLKHLNHSFFFIKLPFFILVCFFNSVLARSTKLRYGAKSTTQIQT